MVLQEALKEPLSGLGEAERRRGGGLGVRAGNPSWRGMECFKRTCSELPGRGRLPLRLWSLSFARSAGSGEGDGKGKRWLSSPFTLSLSLSLVGQPTHRIYARGKRGPERMGSLWRKAGVPHPEFIGTTRGGRLGERGSWACVSVSVSRECVGS